MKLPARTGAKWLAAGCRAAKRGDSYPGEMYAYRADATAHPVAWWLSGASAWLAAQAQRQPRQRRHGVWAFPVSPCRQFVWLRLDLLPCDWPMGGRWRVFGEAVGPGPDGTDRRLYLHAGTRDAERLPGLRRTNVSELDTYNAPHWVRALVHAAIAAVSAEGLETEIKMNICLD